VEVISMTPNSEKCRYCGRSFGSQPELRDHEENCPQKAQQGSSMQSGQSNEQQGYRAPGRSTETEEDDEEDLRIRERE
jgi:hypothetical protein